MHVFTHLLAICHVLGILQGSRLSVHLAFLSTSFCATCSVLSCHQCGLFSYFLCLQVPPWLLLSLSALNLNVTSSQERPALTMLCTEH